MASNLFSLGALWNTMVMVFRADILLSLIHLSSPRLYAAFQRIFQALGAWNEEAIIERVYASLEPLDFSKDLFERIDVHSQNQLLVMPMRDLFWSDLGSQDRFLSVLRRLGDEDRSSGAGPLQTPQPHPTFVPTTPLGIAV